MTSSGEFSLTECTVDCHDGETEPVVYHKLTLTSHVSVREICRAIDKYAFVSSPLPIILSVETHCNAEQQVMMGQIFRACFGDKLVTAPLDDRDELPSPDELKGKIMFKSKPKSPEAMSPTLMPSPPVDSSTTTDSEADSKLSKMVRRLSFNGHGRSLSNGSSRPIGISPPTPGSSTSSTFSSASPRTPKSPKTKGAYSPELFDLCVYTLGVKYNGFSKLNRYLPHHQFSVSDKTADRILKEDQSDWIKHNFTHLSRVYPKGARVMSSNYDPRPLWQAGNQLVAINWQTIDQGTILNHAMFGDTPGYVLKPLALRQKVVEERQTFRVWVQVISAQRLPLGSDLYVEGQIDDVERRTETVKGKSISPYWNHTMEWDVVTVQSMLETTFLRLEIKSKGNPAAAAVGKTSTVAQWARSIGRMQREAKGFRYLGLWDELFSRFVFATLFVRIDVSVV